MMGRKIFISVCFVARYTIMYFFFLLIHFSAFSSSSVTPTMLTDLEYMIPIVLIDLAFFLFAFLAYFSVTRTFAITEPRFNAAVAQNKEALQNFTQRASFVLKTPHIYYELLITAFFMITTSFGYIFMQLHTVIPKFTPEFAVTLFAIASAFILSLLARISAIKELCYKATFEEIKFGRADKKYGIWYLVKNSAILGFIYPLAVMTIPYIFAIAVVPFLFGKKDTFVIITAIVIIVAILISLKYLRVFFKRRKFLKKLKKFCQKNNYKLENESNMLKSAFKEYDGANFVINANGKRYACKLLASKNKANPMYFTENGELYEVKVKSFTFLGNVRGMGGAAANLGSINISKKATVSSFAFESEYPKLVIVNPIPVKIFAGHPDYSAAIDAGSKVGEYRIYNASGFMNAVERDCVER